MLKSGQSLTPPAVEDLDLGTKHDVARICKVSNRTVEKWVKERRIPHIRLGHRLLRFDLAAVAAAVRKWTTTEIK